MWPAAFILWSIIAVSKCDINHKFPLWFKFGAGSSSYQVEGAWNISGKTESKWDHLIHTYPNSIRDLSNGDIACESYHLWRRDIEMISELGLEFYRFSISWPRLLPNGFPTIINEEGKRYYNNLIDGLLEKGIEPVVTIFHYEMPQIFQDLGGFVTRRRMNRQRVSFEEMNADLPGFESFPRHTQRELVIFALGTYQLKLEKSYYSEHVRGNGHFNIFLYRDPERLIAELNNAGIKGSNLWLLRAKIKSRYTRSKLHYTYVLIDENESGLNTLNHYYCSCKTGNRTLGCCAHVMVIIWYLSLARHKENIHRPALFLDSVIIDRNN